ncbi:ATP-binding cassette domain-containing protein [Streptacidiphilus sp. ASG 303]|uniref:ATP-binding cassette domain-containing protein n=1 Tax=Streptacidiphilus sp. ASG 303 TaxID=2896847 RepID=UPI001E560587|nr:ATP-binding cassette domain-containing protein [Streptacidiphilus sp. ASG 303]MCD0484649.1 ATP-binding cassette domain-containing protein [Streptacidiphilus sp. ASG 303]
MIHATGLTKTYRRGRAPALLDLTLDARPGTVTALLGPGGSGKSTAVRLMLGLERGRGAALFGGRPYRALRRPEREVGVVLQARPGTGHSGAPGRTARGHLRMLAAALGVSGARADLLLEQTRLGPVADHRLRTFSPATGRLLSLAAALLGDPFVLLLDAPTDGLSERNAAWYHAFLRAFAASGGTVLLTCRDPEEAALAADRVVTLDGGRQVADQSVCDFVDTRVRREVTVRGPQVGRLADLLLARGAEVRPESGTAIAVAGMGRTEIGEIAYRNGVLLHELADRVSPRRVRQAVPGGLPGTVRAGATRSSAVKLPVASAPGAAVAAAGPVAAGSPPAPVAAPVAAAVPAIAVPVAAATAAGQGSASAWPAGAVRSRDAQGRPLVPVPDPEETVIVLSPGAAVAATVVGSPREDRPLAPDSATPFPAAPFRGGAVRPPHREPTEERAALPPSLPSVSAPPVPSLSEPQAGPRPWSE